MITLDALADYGANTDEALDRCLNNEDFYLSLVVRAIDDKNFAKLRDTIEAGDLEEAFSTAHALKGLVTNLALTPLAIPINEMTQALRNREERDYSGLLDEMNEQLSRLKALA